MREIPKPLGPPVPPGLWAIIQRCLAKEPTQRYQRAGEVQAALEAVQSAAIVSTDPSSDLPSDVSPPKTTMLHSVRHAHVKKGDFLLLVGTTKGAFIAPLERAAPPLGGRRSYFHGHNVYATAYDGRAGQHRIWVSTQSYWGTLLRSSDDFGKSWTNPQQAPIRFPADTGVSLKNIWQITPGRPEEPNVLYCGVEPAALFETRDSGETWSLVRGLFDHPHRPRWMPGNGGLALHTILLDPSNDQRMYVAISSGGVYRTTDGGHTGTVQSGFDVPLQSTEILIRAIIHRIAMILVAPNAFSGKTLGIVSLRRRCRKLDRHCERSALRFWFCRGYHPRYADCVYIVPVEPSVAARVRPAASLSNPQQRRLMGT